MNPASNDEVLAAVALKGKAPGPDGEPINLFHMRIAHRAAPGIGPQSMYLFHNVPGEIVLDTEIWLAQLVPPQGGFFSVDVYHLADRNTPIGVLRFTHPPDPTRDSRPYAQRLWDLADHPAWGGPSPSSIQVPARPNSGTVQLPGAGGGLSPQRQPLPPGGALGDQAFSRAAAAANPSAAERMYEQELQRMHIMSDVQRQNSDLLREVKSLMASSAPRPAEAARGGVDVLQAIKTVAEILMPAVDKITTAMAKKPEKDPIIDALLHKAITTEPNAQLEKMITTMGSGMVVMSQQVMQMGHFFMEMKSATEPPGNGFADILMKAMDTWQLTMEKVGDGASGAAAEVSELAAGESDAQGDDAPVDLILQVELAIRRMRPAEELGPVLVAAFGDKEFRAIFASYGTPQRFVEGRLRSWVEADPEPRLGYVRSVIPAAIQFAVDKGAFSTQPIKTAGQVKTDQARAAAKPAAKKSAPKKAQTNGEQQSPPAAAPPTEAPEAARQDPPPAAA